MRRFARLLCLAPLTLPSPALAQFGSHSGTSSTYSYSGRVAYDELNAFAQCFASSRTADALRLLNTEPGSVDEARVYKSLFSKEQLCLGNLSGLSVPWRYVRGAIGEGFYARRLPVPANFAASRDIAPAKVQSVMDAAHCYVGKYPAEARSLIDTTKPATKQENAAFDALWPHFKACLPANMPKGYKFETLILRYRIAEALWRQGWTRG